MGFSCFFRGLRHTTGVRFFNEGAHGKRDIQENFVIPGMAVGY